MDFDLEDITVGGTNQGAPGPPTPGPNEYFLKGPVPLSWLQLAGRQSGRALHVGIVLWHLAGMLRKRTVRLSYKKLTMFGVDRHAARRGLARLEEAKLVEVERGPGRSPVVTILQSPPKQTI